MIPVTSHYVKEFIMKIACIIPSRYASTRLPGKPLRLIAGETLVHRAAMGFSKKRMSLRAR